MDHLMLLKVNHQTKSLSADSALMGLYFDMDLHMDFQSRNICVTLPTRATHIWLFSSVAHLMFLKVTTLTKGFPTCGALIGPFSSMDPLVSLKVRLNKKGFSTDRALMGLFSSVSCLVYIQV